MASTRVKQREYLLTIDQFNNPAIVEGKEAISILLSRILILEPGSDPLHPDMGVGIKNYRFNSKKDNFSQLEKIIKNQLDTYLPDFANSEIEMVITPDHILQVEITIGDTTYIYNSEPDDSNSTLNDITIS